MTQAGIEKKIYDKYFDNLANTKCEYEPFVVIGFDICHATFYILTFGIILALIICGIEKALYLKKSY